MKAKDIHIVPGETAKAVLTESRILNPEGVELIVLHDNSLNIGPLCDIYAPEDIKQREDYFIALFKDLAYGDIDFVGKDIETIKQLIASQPAGNVYVWLARADYEVIGTARLLHHLSKTKANIYLTNLPNIPVKSIHGREIYLRSLTLMMANQVKTVAGHFNLLSTEALDQWSARWQKALAANTLLRITNKNGEIIPKDETYLDNFLITHCDNEFQSAAMVIGLTLGTLYDMNIDIGDVFLNARLKQLANERKLAYRGELKEIRDYEVRLA